jgi:hydrogenase/urease accessory protein HupE
MCEPIAHVGDRQGMARRIPYTAPVTARKLGSSVVSGRSAISFPRRMFAVLLAFLTLALAAPVAAHEVRPAYLEIDQTAPTTYSVIWKHPTMGDVAIHLEPHLSNGWLDKPPSDEYAAPSFLIKTWKITDTRARPLNGRTVSIDGLQNTITDVFVRVHLLDGQGLDTIVRPETPSVTIAFANGAAMSVSAFLLLGVQHILTGPDHLLFVLGLLLLVRDRWMLLKTVSAFTLAHSLTLAAASFGLISLPLPLLNALIALSILFLAPEVIRARRGGTSLTIRHPWIVAFAFGLLHGMGFASGLTSLGLHGTALVAPLVMFNVGVEIGQLAFIGLVLALRRSFRLMAIDWPRPFALAPTYAIGVLGAMWTIQYSALLFGIGS